MGLSSPLLLARRRCFIWEKLMGRTGGSTRDVGNWLFVVSVAAFALGLMLLMAGLVPPEDRRAVQASRLLGPRHSDTTAMVRANDHVVSGIDQRQWSMAMPAAPPAPTRLTRPAASPPVHDAGQESDQRDDGFSRRTYLLDSATVAHGYLVPRPNTDQVD